MPTTRNIMSSLLFSLPFIGNQPGDISAGQPALDAANLLKQTIMGPPFTWPWNRATLGPTPVSGGDQDYTIPVTTFGFLEQAWLIDAKGKAKEIPVVPTLSVESAIQRPQSCAVELQDDLSISIRLNTLPDQPYTLDGFYQKAPVLMTSLASSWAPIPDNLAYITDWGFLAMMSMITKDIRQQIFMQKFAAHLLGAQDGLTATQRNIFIGEWLSLLSQTDRTRATTQQGIGARSQS
jgi:hypothetical protein